MNKLLWFSCVAAWFISYLLASSVTALTVNLTQTPPSFLVLWLHLILFFSLYHTITSVMLRLHMTTMLAWLGTIETRLAQHQHNPMAPSHR